MGRGTLNDERASQARNELAANCERELISAMRLGKEKGGHERAPGHGYRGRIRGSALPGSRPQSMFARQVVNAYARHLRGRAPGGLGFEEDRAADARGSSSRGAGVAQSSSKPKRSRDGQTSPPTAPALRRPRHPSTHPRGHQPLEHRPWTPRAVCRAARRVAAMPGVATPINLTRTTPIRRAPPTPHENYLMSRDAVRVDGRISCRSSCPQRDHRRGGGIGQDGRTAGFTSQRPTLRGRSRARDHAQAFPSSTPGTSRTPTPTAPPLHVIIGDANLSEISTTSRSA